MFQHTAARRRLQNIFRHFSLSIQVSTHSRPKAAAYLGEQDKAILARFNTQPPEGGCL